MSWKVHSGEVDEKMLEWYVRENSPDVRTRVLAVYRKRFPPKIKFHEQGGHVQERTRYQLCYLCPILSRQSSRRTRIPRLGMLYTFGRSFGSPPTLLNDARDIADVILNLRLGSLLQYAGRFVPRGKKGGRSALSIAVDLGQGLAITQDESTFLVMKIVLHHHYFFPQHPTAYNLISRLAMDPAQVFAYHGLITPTVSNKEEAKSVAQLISDLESDILSLVSACARNHSPNHRHSMEITSQGKNSISEALPIALTLLCGRIRLADIGENPVAQKFAKASPARYFALTPPAKLDIPKKALLPAFSYDDVEGWSQNPDKRGQLRAYVETLHPLGPALLEGGWKGFYGVDAVWVDATTGTHVTERPSGEWYVSYARARCVEEFKPSV